MINLLKKLTAIHSSYPNEMQMVKFMYDFFKNKNYTVKKQNVEKNRYNLLVSKGKGSKSILLYSHMDTVAISSGWNTDPLKLKIIKDNAYGLGAWDMKSGMVAALQAFLDYQPKNIKIKFSLCVDEENISKGGYALIKSKFMKDVACVISPEPAFFNGINGIVTGRIGRAVYDIEIGGVSRHFALYDNKYDINKFSAELLLKLNSLNKLIDKERKQFIFARKIKSEAIGMSIPQKTYIQLDSSVLPPNTHQKILKQIRKVSESINLKYDNSFNVCVNFVKRETPFLEPYEIDKNNPYLRLLSKSVSETTKKKAIPYFRSSVADENIFGSYGFTVLGIGPEGGNAHAPNEWVSITSMKKLNLVIMNFLKKADDIC
ncbi:MAG: ArgE/DapE-related deacylase [Candidatus Roizmanbacteria bacterium GW2011_GWA2_36_23]|uniref:ArgE/DapE-related deacylase n=1 Tax=Candidatus Roizmanbacteria bacterium GW2011_GWA2_36_23 TaxID=1618480 RepID=A0A0G0GQZ2_9BACT|nr:MAG: ArgE/DapE-related deacylase [Candidatus Roizmanbacteria bacterium GW2011_GWA2_36_23]